MKYNNKFKNPKKLRGGGAEELGFNYFYEKNKIYVKKRKEVLVKRQLFEMWNSLPVEEQKEWLYKADAFCKLFAMTNKSDVYKDIVPKYPPTTELCKLLTKYNSVSAYFSQEMANLKQFFQDSIRKEPGCPKPIPSGANPLKLEYYNQHELYAVWHKANTDHIQSQTFTNKVLQEWRSSDNVSVRKSLRDAVSETMTYSTIIKTTNEQIWSKTAKEWQSSYDAFEHAYDMFCEKTKITNPEMKVTDEDVKDHLSRMWEALDTETQNTWIVSAGETLPVRQRRVRGLFEDSDSDEE